MKMFGYHLRTQNMVSLTELGKYKVPSFKDTIGYKTTVGSYVHTLMHILGELNGTASDKELIKKSGIKGKDFYNTLEVMKALSLVSVQPMTRRYPL
jgi:hypothetical protein